MFAPLPSHRKISPPPSHVFRGMKICLDKILCLTPPEFVSCQLMWKYRAVVTSQLVISTYMEQKHPSQKLILMNSRTNNKRNRISCITGLDNNETFHTRKLFPFLRVSFRSIEKSAWNWKTCGCKETKNKKNMKKTYLVSRHEPRKLALCEIFHTKGKNLLHYSWHTAIQL
jgi:hypothetical protein